MRGRQAARADDGDREETRAGHGGRDERKERERWDRPFPGGKREREREVGDGGGTVRALEMK